MPTQTITATRDLTAYRRSREWECTDDGFITELTGAGTGYSDGNLDYCGIVYDYRALTIYRGFISFDLSDAGWTSSSTISSATLKVRGRTYSSADVIAVESSAFTTSAASVFDNDTTTAYSSQKSTWSTSGYNTITLNSTAINDLLNNSNFYVCIKEHDFDYSRSSICRYEELELVTGWDASRVNSVKLEVTYTTPSGYTETVTGISAANMDKINGISKTDIDKVMGV